MSILTFYIFVSKDIKVLSADTIEKVVSDHLPVTAITRVMKDASRIIEDRINGQLALHPELAVDSKLRREIAAKKRGIQLRM